MGQNASIGLNIYYIGYVTKKSEWNVKSANPLHLIINRIDGFIEGKESDKYLNIALTDRSSKVLKKYSEVCNEIKDCIEKINDDKSGEYDKDFMKIKFNSDDNIPIRYILYY